MRLNLDATDAPMHPERCVICQRWHINHIHRFMSHDVYLQQQSRESLTINDGSQAIQISVTEIQSE